MKRGFLNTARSKRVIDEAYAPQPPPSGRPKPSGPNHPSQFLARNCSHTPGSIPYPGGSSVLNNPKAATALEDGVVNVEPADGVQAVTVLQEVHADGHVVAGRVTPCTNLEGNAGNLEPVQDVADVQTMEFQDVYADGRIAGVRVIRSTVDKAKTPSESHKDDHSNQAEPCHGAKDPKGKGKEKAVNVDDDNTTDMSVHNPSVGSLPPRFLYRNPPGWGRHPDEEFFHIVPASHGGSHRKRTVFRLWPRDPNGKHVDSRINHKGTLSRDGYPWGATLYDIFYVNKLPEVPGFMSVVTGSAICKAVEELGELDAAACEIEWAKSEGKPRVEGAASTEELIKRLDRTRHLVPFLNTQDKTERKQDEGREEEDAMEQAPTKEDDGDEDANFLPPPATPPTSPLCLNHDPKWQAFIPFENQLSILLQERIPSYLLPQTLCVHDPFDLLTACDPISINTSWTWTSRPDTIRTYNLHLSETTRHECENKRKKAEELEEFKAHTLIFLRYQRTEEQIKNCNPVIEVPLLPYLRRPTKVEESHLYLSPVAKVGDGNHSVVYKGEWELPRDIFVKQETCSLCFQKSAEEEIQRLKDTGRWDKMLRAASWGPNGFTGRRPTQAELDEVNDLPDLEMDGEIIERAIICVVPPNAIPSKIIEMVDKVGIWDMLMKKRKVRVVELNLTRGKPTNDASVPVIRINPPFSYESQKFCTHNSIQAPIPRTAIFTVVAKLSLEYDPHLKREANNYQMFPEHLFEHYDGYIVINQLHAVVPVNAVVPQFYGYYIPETSKTKGETPNKSSYLSPILLLEHCGKPIDPKELSREDQEECVSLLLRFHRAGWLHESVAIRNFLVQKGKPTEFPLTRTLKPELSFRLIDFGRSREYGQTDEKRREEFKALDMFDKLRHSMNITLG